MIQLRITKGGTDGSAINVAKLGATCRKYRDAMGNLSSKG